MIRPEAITILNPDNASLRGRVESVSFEGDRFRVTVADAASRPLVVDAPNTRTVSPGDLVGLAIEQSAIRLLPPEAA